MKHKKWLVSAVLAFILVALVGCGGLDKQLDNMSVSNGFASVQINSAFKWDEKTDAQKMEIAQYAVKKCADKNGTGELVVVRGFYGALPDRQTVFIYHNTDFPDITIDTEQIFEYESEQKHKRDERLQAATGGIPHVGNVTLFGVEKGIAYYDVAIITTTGFDWNTATQQDQNSLVSAAIAFCGKKAVDDNAESYEVTGLLDDGHTAFMWRGDDKIKVYIDGKYSYEFTIVK